MENKVLSTTAPALLTTASYQNEYSRKAAISGAFTKNGQ